MFLQPHWERWHREWGPPFPNVASQWTCTRSAAFLAFALKEDGLAAFFTSGRPGSNAVDGDGCGFRTADRWEGHAWVICGRHIVDITADQFGQAPVLISGASDQRYRSGCNESTTLRLTTNGMNEVEKVRALWRNRS
jgi:hypothetical protein